MSAPFRINSLTQALLLSAVLGTSLAVSAAPDTRPREYHIAQGDLGNALTRFATEAGVLVSFDPALTDGRLTQGLNGRYSAAQGLQQLLQDSGLKASADSEGRYTLHPLASGTEVLDLDATQVQSTHLGTITESSGSYAPGTLATATRLVLTPKETPQSITVMTRQRMDDFGLNSIDEVMRHAPGVSVTTYDSERTTYNVRGFGVNNFQYDGIPATRVATYSAGQTLSDMAIYDRIEILKGSTGLLTGTGEPGASFNLIRKKPTRDFHGHVTAGVGSWDNYRSELDVGGALTDTGNVRGRAVAAYQDKHSWQDHYQKQTSVYYGVLEFDVTPDTVLSVGADYQDNEPKGSSWGGNPIYDSNGNFNKMSRSFNNGAQWSAWEQYSRTLFTTLEHDFTNGWFAKAHLNHQINGYDAPLGAAAAGNPDPLTGTGASLWVSRYKGETTTDTADVYLSGPFELFGKEHELVVGGSTSRKHWQSKTWYNPASYSEQVSDYYGWKGDIPEPDWEYNQRFDEVTRERGAYATGRFSLTDDLKLILGGRVSDYHAETVSKSGVFTPYTGLVYDLNDSLALYASYTSIFSPQTLKNEQGSALDPLEGKSYETGIKAEFLEGRLNANLAWFEIEQDNYAVRTGKRAPDGTNAYRAEQGVVSKGYEVEVSGELSSGWHLQGGYTHHVARRDGNKVNTIAPESQFNVFTSYTLPGRFEHLTVGGGARWQSKTWATLTKPAGDSDDFTQDAFWLFDLMARYQITQSLSATVNVNNVLDKKYLSIMDIYSVYSWGEPRNVVASMRWDF